MGSATSSARKEREQQDGEAPIHGDAKRGVMLAFGRPQNQQAGERACGDDRDVRHDRGRQHRGDGGEHRHRGARRVGAEGARHAPDGLRHHRRRDDFQPLQGAGGNRLLVGRDAVAEGHQEHCRGQRETDPRGGCAGEPRLREPDADPHLAGGRPRQHLAERDEIGVGAVFDPAPACDEGLAEVADMGDRPAERGQPQQEKGHEDARRRLAPRAAPAACAASALAHGDRKYAISLVLTREAAAPSRTRPQTLPGRVIRSAQRTTRRRKGSS